jgi:hypothetical protein
MISTEQHIETLAKECERIAADIRHFEAMVEKFTGLGITIIGAGFAYGLAQDVNEIFFVLPVGLFGIYYVFIERMRTILWLGAYKRALEDKINELANETVLNWEYLIRKHRGRADVIVRSGNIIYVLILGTTIVYSLFRLDKIEGMHLGSPLMWIYGGLMVFLVSLLIGCLVCWLSAYAPAYKLSKKAVGLLPPEGPRSSDEECSRRGNR